MDYITMAILKGCSDFGPPIAKLANLLFTVIMFKTGQVMLLFKKPGLSGYDMANYRPITNLNTIGKI